jgi:predicted nucleic acid-binding protein
MAFLASRPDEQVAMSLFVVCELEAGARGARDPGTELAKVRRLFDRIEIIVPDERLPPVYGAAQARLTARGERISTMDLLIVATALVDRTPLVTRNQKEFSRVPDLDVLGY